MHISKVKCGKELKCLVPMLNKWIRLNRAYGERMQWKDCAWWANERASVGILAAAAWMTGGVALEEYSTTKVRKMKHGTGRCDLFFTVGVNQFACEAKQIFPRLKKSRTVDFSKVKHKLNAACKDAKSLLPEEGRGLGICFIAPRFALSQVDNMDASLKDYLGQLRTKLKFDAIAWFFPTEGRKMQWDTNRKTYPGVIVLIREIVRS